MFKVCTFDTTDGKNSSLKKQKKPKFLLNNSQSESIHDFKESDMFGKKSSEKRLTLI